MTLTRRIRPWTVLLALSIPSLFPSLAHSRGARLFKTSTIQVTADGGRVWMVNQDNGSVSSYVPWASRVIEHVLTQCAPRGLSVREDGEEVWVTCPYPGKVIVLRGSDGAEIASVDLPWGGSPAFVALSPDQQRAIVTLNHGSQVALINTASRSIERLIPTRPAPLGAAWSRDGASVWITHAGSDGARSFVTRIDVGEAGPRIAAVSAIGMQEPQESDITADHAYIADGGAVILTGHPAQIPAASGSNEVWLPSQHSGINDTFVTSETAIKAAIHRLDPASNAVSPSRRVVVAAWDAHDPALPDGPRHPGWDAHVSGLVDIGFNADGTMAYLLGEGSEDVLVVPTSIAPWRDSRDDARLTEIPVRPMSTGIALSPTREEAYVLSRHANLLSMVNLVTNRDVTTTAFNTTPATGERLTATLRLGDRVLTTSAMPEVSDNQKIACLSCHVGGASDGLIWPFQRRTQRSGPRSTLTLLSMNQTMPNADDAVATGRRGQFHRAGDAANLQSFAGTFTDVLMRGLGFGPDIGISYYGDCPGCPIPPAEVAAMVEAMKRFEPPPRSPHRTATGRLTAEGIRGAAIFRGSGGRPGDAACVSCHPDNRGFNDRRFHDVGSAHPPEEILLQGDWTVNTPTLVGAWMTAPFDDGGLSRDQWQDMLDVVAAFAKRDGTATPHGSGGQLTRRQLSDLTRYVLSIDTLSAPWELNYVFDTEPPVLVSAEPMSLTHIACRFSETVESSTASSPTNWRVVRDDGAEVRVLEARWDATWGDRVTLVTEPMPRDIAGLGFTVLPGAILDAAGSSTGGTANALRTTDPSNARHFMLDDVLTITLGTSGREMIDIEVFDAAMAGPAAAERSDAEAWLRPVGGGRTSRGFVRFDWQDAFREATGVTSSVAIIDAAFTMQPEWGAPQRVAVRRMLQQWDDPRAGDEDIVGLGAPTWDEHGRGLGAWNSPGAGALGGTGGVVSDYFGAFDLSASVDAVAMPLDLEGTTVFAGPGITEAYRFWFDHPTLDMGHALEIDATATNELRFARSERELGARAPRLVIRYRLPPAQQSGPYEPSALDLRTVAPLRVERPRPTSLVLGWEETLGGPYAIYVGDLQLLARGNVYEHVPWTPCVPIDDGPIEMPEPPGDVYFLVTRLNVEGGQSSFGRDSFGRERPSAQFCP